MTQTLYWVHSLDPILIHIGPLPIRWYGLMYILGFIVAFILLSWRQRKGLFLAPSHTAVQDMLFYGFVGLLIGGRIGACFLYEPLYYTTHPWEILAVWQGGMSSHGGFIGGSLGLYLFARRYSLSFIHVIDNAVLAATPGIFFGRIGNFINGELWGRPSTVDWAVIFPQVDMQPRHPVQLYQACTEGLFLFIILLCLGTRTRPNGTLSGTFALLYGILRIATEYFRAETPVLMGPAWTGMTKGQFYSIGLILLGIGLLWHAARHTQSRHTAT